MASKAYNCWNEYWNELDNDKDYAQIQFYHGTSDALDISHVLPSDETGILRAAWRGKLTDKVF